MPDRDNTHKDIKYLVEKYVSNNCTKEELSQILKIIESEKNAEELTRVLREHWENPASSITHSSFDLEAQFTKLMNDAKQEVPVIRMAAYPVKRKRRMYYAAAAVIAVCLISIGAFFLLKPQYETSVSSVKNIETDINDVNPGGNKAVLTLADGSAIILDSNINGTLATQGNIQILKSKGVLSYNNSGKKNVPSLYNTVSTPRGGQYQLILADGTKVWLNAASSLRFPASFPGHERRVELTGEAYFEVAKNAAVPFKVQVNGMEVHVLGTHFNINSYDDESVVRTTLLEGSVRINKNKNSGLLKPGQQAQVGDDGKIRVIDHADLVEAIAWKDGNFQFDKADIHAVMRQIARWYDVDVAYQGKIYSHFGGTISRDVKLSQVLNMLELTGEVKFEIKDRSVVVMP